MIYFASPEPWFGQLSVSDVQVFFVFHHVPAHNSPHQLV